MEKTIELFQQFISTKKVEKDSPPAATPHMGSPFEPVNKSPVQKNSEINSKLNITNKQKEELAGKNQELSEKITFYVKENKGLRFDHFFFK